MSALPKPLLVSCTISVSLIVIYKVFDKVDALTNLPLVKKSVDHLSRCETHKVPASIQVRIFLKAVNVAQPEIVLCRSVSD